MVFTREVHQGTAVFCKKERCKFPAIIKYPMQLLMKPYSLVMQPTKAIKPFYYSGSCKTDYNVLFSSLLYNFAFDNYSSCSNPIQKKQSFVVS